MLKTMFSLIIFVALLLLAMSCHHDSTPSPMCFPTQVTSVTHIPGGQTTTATLTFQYDDKMNLLEIQDDEGALTFTYTDGRITSAQSTSGQVKETWSYNNNGLLSHVDGNPLPGSFFTYTYTEDYTYNNAGELTNIEWDYTSPDTYTLDQTFVSANGNASYKATVINGHDETDSINFSAYDSKRSLTASIAQALGKQKFYFLGSITNPFAVSKNNPTLEYNNGKITLSYEYNSNGYPTKITTTAENGNVTEAMIAYENCQ